MTARAVLAILAVLAGPAVAEDAAGPPANLVAGEPARGEALDPVFSHFALARLGCKFSEEKHVALLARPLRSTGTLHFDRDRGIARTTVTPRSQTAVLTPKSLRIRAGKRTEEIALDKSKDLKAFALIFPTLLRGDRAELERAFEIGLHGSADAWWALAFTPKAESLRKLVKSVVVIGRKGQLHSLQIVEGNGDTTATRLTEIRTNDDVSDAEITKAFGAT
jgi:hypothetical protein